jgi:putative transposase
MVIGYLKGKSAIHIHRTAEGIKKGFIGRHFWSRGYCASTVGLDEEMIRAYVILVCNQVDTFNPRPVG